MHKLLELATYTGLQVLALVLVGVLLALCVLAVKAWDWLLTYIDLRIPPGRLPFGGAAPTPPAPTAAPPPEHPGSNP